MQRGGVNHAVVMSLSWRQEPPSLYNYQRWQGGDEGRKGQRKMTRGSNKLNSPPAGGCHLYSRCARRLNGACKITRTFIHEVADVQRANKQTVSYRCLKKGGVAGWCSWIPIYLYFKKMHVRTGLSFPLFVSSLSFNTQWKGENNTTTLLSKH